MLKITSQSDAGTLSLRLEGRLVAANLAELALLVARHRPHGRRLRLELDQLRFADAAGVALLCQLLHEGAEVATSTPFVGQLLQECAP